VALIFRQDDSISTTASKTSFFTYYRYFTEQHDYCVLDTCSTCENRWLLHYWLHPCSYLAWPLIGRLTDKVIMFKVNFSICSMVMVRIVFMVRIRAQEFRDRVLYPLFAYHTPKIFVAFFTSTDTWSICKIFGTVLILLSFQSFYNIFRILLSWTTTLSPIRYYCNFVTTTTD